MNIVSPNRAYGMKQVGMAVPMKRPQQFTESAAPNAPVHFEGKGKKILLGSGILAGVLSLMSPLFYETNAPGTRSVVVNSLAGGTQKEVRGEGFVLTFPPFFVKNVPYDITKQTVVESMTPSSRDGVPIDRVEIELSFEIDPGPEGNYESLYKIHTQILGGGKGVKNAKGDPAAANTFFSSNNDVTQRLYIQEILPRLRSDVNTVSTLFNADNYQNSREFMTKALSEGVSTTFKDHEGIDRNMDIEPLAKQLAPLGIKLNFIKVTEIDLPNNLEEKRKEQAIFPLRTSNARLEKLKNEAEAKAKSEFAKIATGEREEAAKGEAAVNTKLAEGKVAVANEKAKENLVRAEGQAKVNVATEEGSASALFETRKGEAIALQEEARGNSDAAKLKADGEAKAVVLKADAKATAADAEGKALASSKGLLDKQRIEADSAARKALAGNADIVVIDPKTGLKLNILNVGEGKGLDLKKHIVGEAASKELLTQPTQPAPPALGTPKK